MKTQFVWAILTEKKTYTLKSTMYRKDEPVKVDIKTARYLRNLGLFKFKKIETKDG